MADSWELALTMAETDENRPSVHDNLRRVTELLHKHERVENLVHRQEGPRQELAESLVHMFVVDRSGRLKGLLTANRLLVTDPETPVATVMQSEFVKFQPHEKAQDAANAFERYDVVSTPVTDDGGKLIGRVTVNAVMDYISPRA